MVHLPKQYECLTIAFLQFDCPINQNGPSNLDSYKALQQVMIDLPSLWPSCWPAWGAVRGEMHTLALLIEHRAKEPKGSVYYDESETPDDMLAAIDDTLTPLLPHLHEKPRMRNVALDYSLARQIQRRDKAVVDIYFVEIRADLRKPDRPGWSPGRTIVEDNPLRGLWPVVSTKQMCGSGRACHRIPNEKPDMRYRMICHELHSYLKVPQLGDTIDQALIFEWRSDEHRDEARRSWHWQQFFDGHFESLQKEGKVLSLEHMCLEVNRFPRRADEPESKLRCNIL